ncbi:TatD family hydrolase [Candidatus Kaiserbacteria bacterium]|nr:TatD family hydrolase [Candidatus Kaiserbacteria bacterium]
MQYIDTHAHLNLAQFAADREAVFQKCAEEEVAMINVGTRKDTSQLAMELAHTYEHAFAIVGVHPLNVVSADPDDPGASAEGEVDYDFYKKLAEDPKTVGIGECGFDYFHNPESTYEAQRAVFEAQIALANEVGKPLMLHLRSGQGGVAGGGCAAARNAYDDALDILATEANVPGNAHFYAGTTAQAKRFFDLGYTISFTGVITFAAMYEELVAYAPLDMIHAETDCPYVAPVPYRGQRCEPWMVMSTVAKIAAIKKLPEEAVAAQLRENAERLYKIKV